jgi:hypothetical protein
MFCRGEEWLGEFAHVYRYVYLLFSLTSQAGKSSVLFVLAEYDCVSSRSKSPSFTGQRTLKSPLNESLEGTVFDEFDLGFSFMSMTT